MRRRWRAPGPARKAVAAAAALVGLAAVAVPFRSGFGIQPTGIISAGEPPVAVGTAETITVYLVSDLGLVPVVRPGLPGNPYLGIVQLGVPLTSEERRLGLRTEVPLQAEFRVRREGSSTIVMDVAPGRRWSRIALAQVACTAQEAPGVRRVVFAGLHEADRTGWRTVTCEQFGELVREEVVSFG